MPRKSGFDEKCNTVAQSEFEIIILKMDFLIITYDIYRFAHLSFHSEERLASARAGRYNHVQ